MPACREHVRGVGTEPVAGERHLVDGLDLKDWAKTIAPIEWPAFLFDEVERDIRASITQNTFQAKAPHNVKEQT
jgi:hypothetical protein